MADTPTQTGIVNAALARLGSTRRVQSIAAEPDAQAVWPDMVRLLVASHPWNFALKRRALNAAPSPELSGYTNAFSLPADCLRWLPPSFDGDNDFFEAIQEGELLLSDAAAPLTIRYISRDGVDDVSRWPPHFVEAVTLALAERLAEPVTQSKTKEEAMAERAYMALKAAKRADGLASNGGKPRQNTNIRSSWLQSRDMPYYGSWANRAPGR